MGQKPHEATRSSTCDGKAGAAAGALGAADPRKGDQHADDEGRQHNACSHARVSEISFMHSRPSQDTAGQLPKHPQDKHLHCGLPAALGGLRLTGRYLTAARGEMQLPG